MRILPLIEKLRLKDNGNVLCIRKLNLSLNCEHHVKHQSI